MSKCPPGVICFENFTFIYVIIALSVLLYFVYSRQNELPNVMNLRTQEHVHLNRPNNLFSNDNSYDTRINTNPFFGVFPKPGPSHSFTNVQNDVLLNPYAPPLKDERIVLTNDVRGGIPINVNTRAVDTSYRQVGLLKRMNGPEMLLPLMGRPRYVGRDKWQYYTMSDNNNQIKLPVSFKSKSCTSEYGCDEISNGDTVYVDGMNATFQVTMYDNATMNYLPFV
jgi:hypothetical protein